MTRIDRMLSRLGWVRLRDYGLMVTPEGAIVDLANGTVVASRGTPGFAPPPPMAPMFAAPPPAFLPPPHVPTPVPRSAPMMAVPPPMPAHVRAPVAVAPVVDEDEWEWTIAMARARAVETVAAIAADPIQADAWPKTEQIEKFEATQVEETAPLLEVVPRQRAVTPAKPIVRVMQAKPLPSIARTVIPVPVLPTANASAITPVVRASTPVAPRRIAKGTGPMIHRYTEPAPLPSDEDTKTSVELALPTHRLARVASR